MLRVAIGHDLRSAGRLLCRSWILKGNTPLTGRVPAPLCRPLQPVTDPSTPSISLSLFARVYNVYTLDLHPVVACTAVGNPLCR